TRARRSRRRSCRSGEAEFAKEEVGEEEEQREDFVEAFGESERTKAEEGAWPDWGIPEQDWLFSEFALEIGEGNLRVLRLNDIHLRSQIFLRHFSLSFGPGVSRLPRYSTVPIPRFQSSAYHQHISLRE
ncbi:unnamed protein product, partial [Haemonchus placei]|uniref:Protein CASC1 n=1 Tax=Haemonchus placei TaxID=6290 RepID=A0A0N4W9L1_HAEPC